MFVRSRKRGESSMMDITPFDSKTVRITDRFGHVFTGTAETLSAEYCFHEYGWDEDSIKICNFLIRASDITGITELPGLCILRATETWQQAGAYYVRIQAMAKKHHITLRAEFDEHDGAGDTRYIVVTDDDFPVATARMYPIDQKSMMIGRVVVLPDYRHLGIGRMVVHLCEEWAEEMGYEKTVVESRDNKVAFYRDTGYEVVGEAEDGITFRCIRMEKVL